MSAPTLEGMFTPDGDGLVDPTSEAVAATRLQLFAAAVDAPQAVGSFTDEELAALDDLEAEPLAPSPWFSRLSADERATALTAALRGLTARGVYRADPLDAATGEFTFRTLPEVLALLTMRRHCDRVVVAERRGARTVDWTLAFAQRAGLWLLERVDHLGVHVFELCTAEHAATALAAWCGAVPGAPTPALDLTLSRERAAAADPVLEPVGRSTLAVTVTEVEPANPAPAGSSGIFTGPEGAYLSRSEPGGAVSYRGVPHAGVVARWAELLGAP